MKVSQRVPADYGTPPRLCSQTGLAAAPARCAITWDNLARPLLLARVRARPEAWKASCMVQWRTRPTRSRRRPPAGFIAPCLPIPSDEIPVGPAWMHELKWDGYRIITRSAAGLTRLWSRNALDWSAAFPQIVAAIGALPVKSITLDGEAVCLREDGRPDFNRLRTAEGCAEARLIAFDLLELDGQDLFELPLYERRAELKRLLTGAPEPFGIPSRSRERTARRSSAMPAGSAPRGSSPSGGTCPIARVGSPGGGRSNAPTTGGSNRA